MMTEKRLDRDQIENIVLQTIMARPFHEFGGCRVYYVAALSEVAVIKGLTGTAEAKNLADLEDQINDPVVKNVFIDKAASITSKGLKNVLSRTNLTKEVFCAFPVKE